VTTGLKLDEGDVAKAPVLTGVFTTSLKVPWNSLSDRFRGAKPGETKNLLLLLHP